MVLGEDAGLVPSDDSFKETSRDLFQSATNHIELESDIH